MFAYSRRSARITFYHYTGPLWRLCLLIRPPLPIPLTLVVCCIVCSVSLCWWMFCFWRQSKTGPLACPDLLWVNNSPTGGEGYTAIRMYEKYGRETHPHSTNRKVLSLVRRRLRDMTVPFFFWSVLCLNVSHLSVLLFLINQTQVRGISMYKHNFFFFFWLTISSKN